VKVQIGMATETSEKASANTVVLVPFAPLGASARRSAPELIYRPSWGLNDISVLSESYYGRSVSMQSQYNVVLR
jgi:hypothetical protein